MGLNLSNEFVFNYTATTYDKLPCCDNVDSQDAGE